MSSFRILSFRSLVGALILFLSLASNAVGGDAVGEVRAVMESVTDWYEAVGTIRPKTASKIEAQVTAEVLDVKVRPGDRVEKGQVLIILDNRPLTSRRAQAISALESAVAAKNQAHQGVAAAEAAFNQALAQVNRIRGFFRSEAATAQELEAAESTYRQAEAGLHQARAGLAAADAGIRGAGAVVRESEISLGYAVITAPEEGEILGRLVEPGDLAMPGKPLLAIQTGRRLRMEAYVREGAIVDVAPGSRLSAYITATGQSFDTVVEEIVPYADPMTRTFLIKTSLPAAPGLYPGMFGRLRIPVEVHSVVVIPENAVKRVGQLEIVEVREADAWVSRYIQTGERHAGGIEVLSGLSGGEILRLRGDE
ncbi:MULTISPECIES: efflux RND transporter periplasmic adaptor subunit [Desulfococcus]|jgi:RND family efflux transporter MFP subunit|uniref:Efflux transporter, RND family, MFP subunit n=1 Tax=Desulfococcus multivorans DSM 2059 TaxID=1121405 RepID=S7V5Z1_DESML|nr:efflux RND transporter periplasmic adaptor subunit [Desulfococcus multivorans]AOY59462.1 efflux transporter, RND family, membrane fusion protein [Desulfococcus multivorans]AQV01664.1 hypothetical protein B2D07_13430 [Desulfococcus multivorans]EPR40028.1 efflux transporter, RND family, MFP subunit [Desulfococcus multivorans DSM 2059]MDX9817353.1 efflux RND transporter periplasmic adaptor subunit [Desulfococcus multivorans]SKA01144.1 RND family efflux transporter, MFP subunit [Desulfococcus m